MTANQTIARRPWLRAALLLGVATGALLLGAQGRAQPARSELRIGFQKGASLFVLQKAQGSLERRFASLNVGVKWVEFPAGPQLLEGLIVTSVITTRSVKELGLAPGRDVIALVKATEVSLATL